MKKTKIVFLCLAFLSLATMSAALDLSGTLASREEFYSFVPAVNPDVLYVSPLGTWNAATDGERVFGVLRNQSNDLAENFTTPLDIRKLPSATDLNADYEKNNSGVMDDANTLQKLNANKEWDWYHRNSHPHTITQFHSDMTRDPLLALTTVKNTVGHRS